LLSIAQAFAVVRIAKSMLEDKTEALPVFYNVEGGTYRGACDRLKQQDDRLQTGVDRRAVAQA
jgi:hypothetical protein